MSDVNINKSLENMNEPSIEDLEDGEIVFEDGAFDGFEGQSIMVIGHQKGRDTKERQYRNFGMPRPEGYRKALRLFRLAEKFSIPIITFIDTPGAYPGIGAEERGQCRCCGRGEDHDASSRYAVGGQGVRARSSNAKPETGAHGVWQGFGIRHLHLRIHGTAKGCDG